MMAIDLLHRAKEEDAACARGILDKDRSEVTEAEIEWVIKRMEKTGALEHAQTECLTRAEAAEKHLDGLPETEARETLREMCAFLVERVF